MLCKVKCVTFKGLSVVEVTVEVSVVRGLPAFEIVGLPNKSVEESKHRIKSAFITNGYGFADSRITVNLAPADIIKMGSCYDLAIAVGIYCAKNKVKVDPNLFFFGELSLDGYIRHTRGAYLALDCVSEIKGKIFISSEVSKDFRDFVGAEIFPVSRIGEVFDHLSHKKRLLKRVTEGDLDSKTRQNNIREPFITDVIGQQLGKRALEIAAAGGHNLMLVGSPGTGKSMLAKSVLSILPPMSESEAIELKRIHSYAGESYVIQRPFRAPHHTISYSGMIGGGAEPLPGEVTLAHNGVLFMDEFCEFSRNVLEALRQPMQDGYITLTRHNMTYTFPSRFILLAASNPCPCGYFGHASRACLCTEQKIATYSKKLSGPVADRFDIFVPVYPEEDFTANLTKKSEKQSSLEECLQIKNRVTMARNAQNSRLSKYGSLCNAFMTNSEVLSTVPLSNDARKFLHSAYKKLQITPRGYFKLLKLARTIADIEQSSKVETEHLAEAVQYRQR